MVGGRRQVGEQEEWLEFQEAWLLVLPLSWLTWASHLFLDFIISDWKLWPLGR